MAVFKPGQDSDDCHAWTSIVLTGGVIFGDSLGNNMTAGIRFPNMTISNGATILSATVTLQAVDVYSTGTVCNAQIKGEAIDDAVTFSTYADFIGRTRTTAYVNWDAVSVWTIDTDYNSPSITTIIQEIINRAGWVSGNDLVIFIADNGSSDSANRTFKAYDQDTNYCARLTVTYSGEIRTLFRPY